LRARVTSELERRDASANRRQPVDSLSLSVSLFSSFFFLTNWLALAAISARER